MLSAIQIPEFFSGQNISNKLLNHFDFMFAVKTLKKGRNWDYIFDCVWSPCSPMPKFLKNFLRIPEIA